MALTDNLVSYYKLDGNSNDSVGSNNGTDTSVSYSASYGKISQGVTFTAATSSRITTAGPAFGLAGTISFWYYCTSFRSGGAALYLFDGSAANRYIVYFYNTGSQMAWYLNGTAVEDPGAYAPTLNTWTHVVLTWDNSLGSNKQAVYINGSLDHNVNTTITAATPTNFYIGNRYTADSNLIGYLDEIGIWSRALTSDEITTLYNSGSGLQYPFTTTAIKSINSLAYGSVKSYNGLAKASIKNINGLA